MPTFAVVQSGTLVKEMNNVGTFDLPFRIENQLPAEISIPQMIKICDKHKVKTIYAYHEEKDGKEIKYGWIVSDNLSLEHDVILSYPSKTKKTKEEKAWSDNEGVTATSMPDCIDFFVASTGYEPERFMELSDELSGEFIESWLKDNPEHTEDTFIFIASLATLIYEKKSFNMFGRGFKVIST